MGRDVLERIEEFHAELTAIRHDIHAHPELGLAEVRTASVVSNKLRQWGIAVTEGVGGFGADRDASRATRTPLDWPSGRHGCFGNC